MFARNDFDSKKEIFKSSQIMRKLTGKIAANIKIRAKHSHYFYSLKTNKILDLNVI